MMGKELNNKKITVREHAGRSACAALFLWRILSRGGCSGPGVGVGYPCPRT